ncbi:MAG: hypothetical protein GC191_00945 [Azospirillum sp.]|nr:hypothetical protein [Azospirillum sp.]
MVALRRIVSAEGRSYLVSDDRAVDFAALVVGAVLDDSDGTPLTRRYDLKLDDPSVVVLAKERGYVLAGDPAVALGDHTVPHTLDLSFTAAGFRPLALAVTVPANPAFPVAGPDATLRRLPVSLRGRIRQRADGTPIPGASLALTGPALPAPRQAVLLAAPLAADLDSASTVQGYLLSAVASPVPVKTVIAACSSGALSVRVDDRQGLASGQLLRFDPASRPRYAAIASVSALPPNPALPGDVVLTEPLAISVPAGTPAAPFVLGAPAGGVAQPVGRDFAGEAILILDAAVDGEVLEITAPGPTPTRYFGRNLVADGQGEFRADGITRLSSLVLTASAAGFTSLAQTWVVQWANPIATADWSLVP